MIPGIKNRFRSSEANSDELRTSEVIFGRIISINTKNEIEVAPPHDLSYYEATVEVLDKNGQFQVAISADNVERYNIRKGETFKATIRGADSTDQPNGDQGALPELSAIKVTSEKTPAQFRQLFRQDLKSQVDAGIYDENILDRM